jgi:hypothetical protein
MDHQLTKPVKSESTWTFGRCFPPFYCSLFTCSRAEDGELEITLFKMLKAETWLSVFV